MRTRLPRDGAALLRAPLACGSRAARSRAPPALGSPHSSRSLLVPARPAQASRIYHYITLVVTFCAACSYLVMMAGFMESKPLGPYFDFVWVHYADWVVTTPMLLLDLGMLAGMGKPEVFLLYFFDVLMIGSGYGSQLAWTSEGMWPLYIYSCVCELLIMVILMTHLRMLVVEHDGTAEGHAFQFLSVWTFCVWWTYPVLFLLVRYELISYDIESVCYSCLDMLAKGIFGFVLVGSREALEGETTAIALMAMSMIGVKPEHRRTSIDQPAIEEIRSLYHSQSPAAATAAPADVDAAPQSDRDDGNESVAQYSSFRAEPSLRVAVREGDNTSIYNMNVRGSVAAAPETTAAAGSPAGFPTQASAQQLQLQQFQQLQQLQQLQQQLQHQQQQQAIATFLAANPALAAQFAALGSAPASAAANSPAPSPAPSPPHTPSRGGSLMGAILAQAAQAAQVQTAE